MGKLKLVEQGLIKVYQTDTGEFVVDGRELWAGVESKQKFTDWVNARLLECEAVEDEEFFISLGKTNDKGGRPAARYTIKLDTAKEMAMLERNESGKEYRRYFIEVEKRYKNGEYAKMIQPDASKEKLAEAKLNNSKARIAGLYLKIADSVPVAEYKQVMQAKATEVLCGEMLIPLPKSERPTYSATEIGERLSITANKVGKLANANQLKTPEYGLTVWDKSPYSTKQIEAFRYYDNVIPILQGIINQGSEGEIYA